MRVLHVAPYFPPQRRGGVGVYAARLHRALLAAGHESHVLTRGAGPRHRSDEPGVERIATSAAGWFAALLCAAPRAAEFEIVHVHAGEALPLLLALRSRRRRPRLVATWHVSYASMARSLDSYTLEGRRHGGWRGGWRAMVDRPWLAWGHRAVDRAALPLADAVVPITRACARELFGDARGGAAPVIYHGLPELADPARADGDRVELLYVGAAGPRKRADALPFVLARVRVEVPGARLRIVGIAPRRAPALRRAFAARGLAGAVDWVGAVPGELLPAYYRAADVMLVPSAYEGLPLVLVEAMQCGLPVVATRLAGHAEAIDDGESGFLVGVDDPAAMAARCVELLRSESLRRRLGAAAARVAGERFGMERHLREYVALYARLREAAA